jgi:hypothetical protein
MSSGPVSYMHIHSACQSIVPICRGNRKYRFRLNSEKIGKYQEKSTGKYQNTWDQYQNIWDHTYKILGDF